MEMIIMEKTAVPASSEQIGNVSPWSGSSPQATPLAPLGPRMEIFRQASDYWVDAWQRSILFLDVLRQHGNEHFENVGEQAPNVVSVEIENVQTGQKFDRPHH